MGFEIGKYVERIIGDTLKEPGRYDSKNIIKEIHLIAATLDERYPTNEECWGILAEVLHSGEITIKDGKLYPKD